MTNCYGRMDSEKQCKLIGLLERVFFLGLRFGELFKGLPPIALLEIFGEFTKTAALAGALWLLLGEWCSCTLPAVGGTE